MVVGSSSFPSSCSRIVIRRIRETGQKKVGGGGKGGIYFNCRVIQCHTKKKKERKE